MSMEDVIGIIVVTTVVLGISVVLFIQYLTKKKQTAASWTGTVVDKSMSEHVHTSDRDDNSGAPIISLGTEGSTSGAAVTRSYDISVRGDSGETFQWPVSSGFYETVSIGDKLSKPAGTMTPEIIEKASPAQPVQEVIPSTTQTPPQGPTTPTPL